MPVSFRAEAVPEEPADSYVSKQRNGYIVIEVGGVVFNFNCYSAYSDDVGSNQGWLFREGSALCSQLGLGVSDDWETTAGPYSPRVRPLVMSDAGTGSWSWSLQVEEFVLTDDPADGWTLIDGVKFPTGDAGALAAIADGLPIQGMYFFEQVYEGAQLFASCTVGELTVSLSHTFGASPSYDFGNYVVYREAFAYAQFDTTDYRIAAECEGVPFGESSTVSETSSGSSGTVTTGAEFSVVTTTPAFTALASRGRMWSRPREEYEGAAVSRKLGDGPTDAYGLTAKVYNPNYNVTLGSTPTNFSIRYTEAIRQPLGVLKADFTINELGLLRAFWQGLGSDDSRDWRGQFQTYPYDALRVAQAETITLASGTMSPVATSLSLASNRQNWEGYRWLRIECTGLAGARSLQISFGGKSYIAEVSPGSPNAWVDLRDAANRPPTLRKDERDSRYPVDAQSTGVYLPNGAPPLLSGTPEEYGWITSGNLGRGASVSVTGWQTGDSVGVTLYLKRRVTGHIGVLLPFQSERKGWESETDNTFLDFDVQSWADGMTAPVWPGRAHVVPLSGAASYVYYTLTQMAAFIQTTPGWTCDILPSPDGSPVLVGGSAKLQSAALPAGSLDPYVFPGSGWTDQTYRSAIDPVDLVAVVKVDELRTYPHIGIPWGAYGERFPIRLSKVFKGEIEGSVYDDSGPAEAQIDVYRVTAPAGLHGSVSSGSDGTYRSVLDLQGNIQYRAELSDEAAINEVWRANNRFRGRTSFTVQTVGGAGPWVLQTPEGRLHVSQTVGGNVVHRVSDATVPAPGWSSEITLSLGDAETVATCYDPITGRIWLMVGRTAPRRAWITYSDDEGRTFAAGADYIMGAYFPSPASGYDATTVRVWAEYQTGTSGPMVAKGRFRGPGDTAESATFTFLDGSGNPILVKDRSMSNVAQAREGQTRWTWAPVVNGETVPSLWVSYDDCRTWERLS